MAHSRIFQIANRPIDKDDYATSDQFYENSDDFAEYIGGEIEDEDERKDDMESLAYTFRDLFEIDAKHDALIYKGAEALEVFKRKWVDAIHEKAMLINKGNIMEWMPRWEMRHACDRTHLCTNYRFYIEEDNDFAGPAEDLVEYVARLNMKQGDRLYVGAIIDFHD